MFYFGFKEEPEVLVKRVFDMIKAVFLTEDYVPSQLDRLEFDAFVIVMRQIAEYQVLFDIFDSSIKSDNAVSRQEFVASLPNLKLLRSSLKLTEDDFFAALEHHKEKELTFALFSKYLIRKNYITVLI